MTICICGKKTGAPIHLNRRVLGDFVQRRGAGHRSDFLAKRQQKRPRRLLFTTLPAFPRRVSAGGAPGFGERLVTGAPEAPHRLARVCGSEEAVDYRLHERHSTAVAGVAGRRRFRLKLSTKDNFGRRRPSSQVSVKFATRQRWFLKVNLLLE